MAVLLTNADALRIPLADESVHCVVTSPPYWGLRDYSVDDQLGLEPTPEEHVAAMVQVFREVRRVLRSDGTLWLNYGDSYASGGRGDGSSKQPTNAGSLLPAKTPPPGLKPLDLCNIPHRVAAALQADGWYWRSTIVWHKPNPMPESQNGWRWERCRVKVKKARASDAISHSGIAQDGTYQGINPDWLATWADCPGCAKCAANDGLVLRRGNWRPTTSHEYIFMLAKSVPYYCDADAVREGLAGPLHAPGNKAQLGEVMRNDFGTDRMQAVWGNPAGRNARTVWEIATQPYPGAHFATFPVELPRRCIKAGTSEAGVCAKCGSPWARIITHEYEKTRGDTLKEGFAGTGLDESSGWAGYGAGIRKNVTTLGFRPTCTCAAPAVPGVVFDPFCGSGTTGLAAREQGQHFVGLDLSLPYLRDQARQRLSLDALQAWEQGAPSVDGQGALADLPLFDIGGRDDLRS